MFVTTFSQKGYEQYGKAFLESFVQYWNEKIIVYYEDQPGFEHERIEYRSLFEIKHMTDILAMTSFPIMQGIIGENKKAYNRDIHRFCRKIMAQLDAAKHCTERYLIWIDSDVIIQKPLPDNWIEDQFNGNCMIYMDRNQVHGCSSFVGWDLKHEQSPLFWQAYWWWLSFGAFLQLPEWHDIAILEKVRDDMNISYTNLAENINLPPGLFNVFDAVFDGIAIHNKGKMKKGGPRRYGQLTRIVYDLKPKEVVEIGTWNGERALEMIKVNPDMKYIGFDLFEDATRESDEIEKNVKPHHTLAEVRKKLNGHNVQLIKGNTNSTLSNYANEHQQSADLVYVDGGHSVETIRSDFNNALRLAKPGSVIVLDDYYVDMPESDLDQWGCNRVLEQSGYDYTVLPISDPVKGGGRTKMAMVQL